MFKNFMYYLILNVLCFFFIITSYNTFLLFYTYRFFPLFFFLHLGLVLVLGAAIYFYSEYHPVVKLVISVIIAVFLLFLNSMISSFPADEYDARVETLNKEALKTEASLGAYFDAKKQLPATLDELVKFDPKCTDLTDPFSYPEKKLAYVKVSDKIYRLISVGPDQKDDGGSFKYNTSFNYRTYIFPWEMLFLGERMRNMTELKGKNLGDIVLENEVNPAKKQGGKAVTRTTNRVKFR